MKSIDEMCAVMQAYKEGKTIEYRMSDCDDDWCKIDNIHWDWHCFDYRVKPEPKYVPYDSVSEVDRNKWVREKVFPSKLKAITMIDTSNNRVFITATGWLILGEFFEYYEYEDGTPCGKLVSE